MEMKEITTGKLRTRIYDNRQQMGQAAAVAAAGEIRRLLEQQETVNILFAAAPSQNEFLASLQEQDIEWGRVNALHMDDYLGLPEDAPQRFGNFLRRHLFDHVPLRSVYFLYQKDATGDEICDRYSKILTEHPLDIVCMGIGENGHIAFNDPSEADFNDPKKVKVVALDDVCRMQQVHDGCFASIDDVPRRAVTVTIPVMMAAKAIFNVVPGRQKAEAVKAALYGPVSTACPASVLRQHANATLFCDKESGRLIL